MYIKSQASGLGLLPGRLVCRIAVLHVPQLIRRIVALGHFQLNHLQGRGLPPAPVKIRRDKKIRGHLCPKGNHPPLRRACIGNIRRCPHLAELAVPKFHNHSGDGLGGAGRSRPNEGNRVGVGNAVFQIVEDCSVIAVLQKRALLAVFDGADGAHTIPDLCPAVGRIDLGVNVCLDALVLRARIFHHDIQGSGLHIQTVADGDGSADLPLDILQGHGLGLCHIALLIIPEAEISPKFQKHPVIRILHAALIVGLVLISLKLIGGALGVILRLFNGYNAVSGRHIFRLVCGRKLQHGACGILFPGFIPVKYHLVGSRLQRGLHLQVHGILGRIHDYLVGRNHHILSSRQGLKIGHIGAGIPQKGEVLAGNIQIPGPFRINHLGLYTVEGNDLPQHAGTEQVKFPAA